MATPIPTPPPIDAFVQFRQIYDDAPESIDIPQALQHRRIEVAVMLLDEAQPPTPVRKRTPPPHFAGRVKELGDVLHTLSAEEWGLIE